MGLKTKLQNAANAAANAVGLGKKKSKAQLLPVGTTWESPEGQALLAEVLQQITPHEADAMLQYKKANPQDYKDAIGHVKNQL